MQQRTAKRKPEAVLGSAIGVATGLWVGWAYSHPDRKVLNLAGLLALVAVSAVSVGLAHAMIKDFREAKIAPWWALGLLLTGLIWGSLRYGVDAGILAGMIVGATLGLLCLRWLRSHMR